MPDPTPRSADEYLRESMGNLIAQLLVQAAVLRAENDQLKAQISESQKPKA